MRDVVSKPKLQTFFPISGPVPAERNVEPYQIS